MIFLLILGITVANDIFMEVKEDLMEHVGMELHSLLDIMASLVRRLNIRIKDLQDEYGDCSSGNAVALGGMLREEAERYDFEDFCV